MNPAVRFAWFVLASASVVPLPGQTAPPNRPHAIQHFGPLLVVAFNDGSPDPVTLRGDLLGVNKEERMRALRAMGIESSPELRELWSGFLRDHAGDSDDKSVMQFISGGMLNWNFGDPGAEPAVLDAGFDEETDHPLEMRAVFVPGKSAWRHVATVACRCQMFDGGQPFNEHPERPDPRQEWVITLVPRMDETTLETHWSEIQFRLRNHRLWSLIQLESRSRKCLTRADIAGNCDFTSAELEKAPLVDGKGKLTPGYVVITRAGHEDPRRMVQLAHDRSCKAYVWDESEFEYLPSPLKPRSCGGASSQRATSRP